MLSFYVFWGCKPGVQSLQRRLLNSSAQWLLPEDLEDPALASGMDMMFWLWKDVRLVEDQLLGGTYRYLCRGQQARWQFFFWTDLTRVASVALMELPTSCPTTIPQVTCSAPGKWDCSWIGKEGCRGNTSGFGANHRSQTAAFQAWIT